MNASAQIFRELLGQVMSYEWMDVADYQDVSRVALTDRRLFSSIPEMPTFTSTTVGFRARI
jgi:hypothetical protein